MVVGEGGGGWAGGGGGWGLLVALPPGWGGGVGRRQKARPRFTGPQRVAAYGMHNHMRCTEVVEWYLSSSRLHLARNLAHPDLARYGVLAARK